MSPPAAASPPPVSATMSMPSLMDQPFSGKVFSRAPRQPAVVFPSHRSFQPSCFSRALTVFGM